MSRRCHHGSPRHARQLAHEQRRGQIVADRLVADDRPAVDGAERRDGDPVPQPNDSFEPVAHLEPGERVGPPDAPAAAIAPTPAVAFLPHSTAHVEQRPAWTPATARPPALSQVPATPHEPRHADVEAPTADGIERGATAPQLRRFIKSRAYVPLHELRRRFAINGGEDDVTPIDVERQRIYVGLPPREGGLLGELLRAGDIGYELSLDPIAPIVVGVYPMRPVPRS